MPAVSSSDGQRNSGPVADAPRGGAGSERPKSSKGRPNWFVRVIRSVFGYRKTSLTFLVFITFIVTIGLSALDSSLEFTVSLPSDSLESSILQYSWSCLQHIGATEHTYTSRNNDEVHDFLEKEIKHIINNIDYIDFDNDLNYTNNIMHEVKYLNYDSVAYYESNNLLVRVNGTDSSLPALLLSAHFDSVPSAYGITDDGMGVVSLIGVLKYLTAGDVAQPTRTIIFNFNNNEEFGLYGATAFLSHPWFSQIGYFLNLEGTGAGGKAMLFRGSDYGIVKEFSSVRFPYATSLFQQGFNNKLIHSETDYAVYNGKGGIRGLDLAFYRPRDLYHTAGDNIKNVNIKSLWHMLSCALDFTKHISSGSIDLDKQEVSGNSLKPLDFAAFTSFLGVFLAIPISGLVLTEIVLLVFIPVISLLLLIVIFNSKRAWNVNFVNVVKFPLSFAISIILLSFCFDVFVIPINSFLVNSSSNVLLATLVSAFLLFNYVFLNGLNALLRPFKGHQHDEKLIVILELSFAMWCATLYSTVKLSKNKLGDDHTGEFFIPILFLLQAVAGLVGLVGWSLKRSQHLSVSADEAYRPLLSDEPQNEYGSSDHESIPELTSLSLFSEEEDNCDPFQRKSFSYDWLIQFLLLVPIPSLIIYNSGSLVLEGLKKSIQESAESQDMLYELLKAFAILWTVPFLPFIFKANKFMVLVLFMTLLYGLVLVATKSAFDQLNPIKLRFLETVDLNSTPPMNTVTVSGRSIDIVSQILEDMPSFKNSENDLIVETLGDGLSSYSWNSSLVPSISPGTQSLQESLTIEILKNSSSSSDAPFGMLTGEIKIYAKNNRNCKVDFSVSDSVVRIFDGKKLQQDESPVKSVTVFSDQEFTNGTVNELASIPASFSKDKHGNYVFKDFDGINQLQLNKLDWEKPYHLGFQWVPKVADSDVSKINVKKLGVMVECYWTQIDPADIESTLPAYKEVLDYSPNYVSWANRDRGLLSLKRYVEL